jgi:uncharacterized damage-inducible protein DinB
VPAAREGDAGGSRISERARALAEEFERANEDFISAVEALRDDDWRARCEAEGWSVAFTARHVGSSHALITGWVCAVAIGQPPTMTRDQVDEINDREASEHATCGREEAVALLGQEGEAAARLVRTLTDEQLRRTGPMFLGSARERSAEDIIERILIRHIGEHRRSIEGAAK